MNNILNTYFTTEFWRQILDKLVYWGIEELPSIAIMTILVLVGLRLIKLSLKKISHVILKRAAKHSERDINETEKRINTLQGITWGMARVLILSLYSIILLKKFGVDIAPIIAGAGILGLAVGFGAQELVRDFISGFFILLEDQIRTGDVAVINGTNGLVERIELRTITLRDFNGVVHIFQNGKIDTLSNMTKEWSAMVFDIGVAYKEDVDHVMDVMSNVGAELANDSEWKGEILEPIKILGLQSFDDSAVVIRARIKTKPIRQWDVGREYRRRLKKEFDRLNIEIPFPHRTIYWGEEIKPLLLKSEQETNPK